MDNRIEITLKFNGSDEQDVQEFLFKYSNYVMQGKTDEQKAECIYAHLDGVALSRYREKFISTTGSVWVLSDERRQFGTVSDWLASEFQKDIAPDQHIRNAVEMSALPNHLKTSAKHTRTLASTTRRNMECFARWLWTILNSELI